MKYWMHNNLITVYGQKMGKSLGNFITLKDAFKKFDPLVIRFFILQSHYRSTLDFSEQAIDAAAKGFDKLTAALIRLKNEITKQRKGTKEFITSFDEYRKRFFEAMDDDFNAPLAIGVLFELIRETNDLLNDAANASHTFLVSVDQFLTHALEEILGLSVQSSATGSSSEPQLMELLIAIRNDARKNKNFAISDKIRDDLKAAGIVLEDGKEGTTWKRT